MHQVKLFKSIESDLEQMQAEINAWLADAKIKVISITGNIAPQSGGGGALGQFSSSDLFLVVLYEASEG